MTPAATIRFPAAFWSGHYRTEVSEFKLGPGPCGLTVTALLFQVDDGALTIVQHHAEDVPAKRFVYPLATIAGRVEIEHLP